MSKENYVLNKVHERDAWQHDKLGGGLKKVISRSNQSQ